MSVIPDSGSRDRLGELFEHALGLKPEECAAFIEAACRGDAALQADLTSLLASHAAAPAFLERLGERILPIVLDTLAEGITSGQRVGGRYEILERIGGGGMGVVYKAHDSTLHRPVALKFLPAYRWFSPAARARLKREAQAASALDHPNIAVVHDIGATDPGPDDPEGGALFIAMAYYPGETLEQRIGRGPLTIPQAIDHAVQLADALAAAHQADIVHRDIKPANVLVTHGGLLKVVDFGVAVEATPEPTSENDRAGTVAYMSPEQAHGGPVDHRTDLWSLGVVLYEMLTGERPFRGDMAAVFHGIRNQEPVPIRTLREEIPPRLVHVVERCLAKDPSRRYQTAAALRTELRSVASGLQDYGGPSIAVLPFANISPDPGNEYFSDGLTEEIIGDLSRLRTLKVISRTSAMRLNRSGMDVPSIARELGVRYVLEGGVRRTHDALRISVRLIDAHRDEQLWSRQFKGTMPDLFEIQEQVARAVVEALRIRLTSSETRQLANRAISDLRAYEAYLRARHEAWRFSREGLANAERYIEAALAIVGDNDLLYGTLGLIVAMHREMGNESGTATIERVEELATRVFTLNPDSAHGHFLKSYAAFHRGDLRGAIHAGERALAVAPHDPDTLLLLGYVQAHAGRNGEARTLFQHALEVDPLTPLTQGVQGFVPIMEGRFGEAIGPYRRCHAMDPDSGFSGGCLGWALAHDRQIDEACAVLDAVAARFPGTAFAGWSGSLAHGLRGDSAAALRAITPAFETAGRNTEMFARALADCHALAGANARALDWLERAIELGMLNYDYVARHDWFLDGVRPEPRFQALLERIRRSGADLL
jgi:serine/threonine protein kinase